MNVSGAREVTNISAGALLEIGNVSDPVGQ
jgi:hypothetical protein